MSNLGNYDGWKLRTPEDEMPPDPRDDTTCPHGEDTPEDCPTCRPDDHECTANSAEPCDNCRNLDEEDGQ